MTHAVDCRNIHVIRKTKEMHSLAHRGDLDGFERLFAKPRNQSLLDINAFDANGDSSLHIVAKSGKVKMVQMCLNLGADPFLKNRKGKIPFEVAKDEAVRTLLKEAPMVQPKDPAGLNGKAIKMEGFLGKWTNYAEGYRRRWFVLEDGILSYYKSQVDYPVSCRGSLNLQFVQVVPHSSDRLRFDVDGIGSTIR
jgi:oxysterol-binding protein 1